MALKQWFNNQKAILRETSISIGRKDDVAVEAFVQSTGRNVFHTCPARELAVLPQMDSSRTMYYLKDNDNRETTRFGI